MTITPISNVIVSHTNGVNFNGRRNSEPVEIEDGRSYRGPIQGLKQVPVIVLMAMSPLNSASVEPYNPITDAPKVEVVDGVQQDSPLKMVGRTIYRTKDGQTAILIEYDKDGNKATFERCGFGYRYRAGNGVDGVMNGIVRIICPEPLSDGSYRIVFSEIHSDAPNDAYKVYRVPKEFGELILDFANFSRNNKAIFKASEEALVKKFGEAAVKNPPTMEEEVTAFEYDDGTEKRIIKSR